MIVLGADMHKRRAAGGGQDHEQHHPGGDVAGALDLGQGAEVVSCHTEVERRLAGLQQEANAENDDPGASDESDQQSSEMHGRVLSYLLACIVI